MPGTGGYVDQSKRKEEFIRRHPAVVITTPRQNSTGEFVADWNEENDVRGTAHHPDLGALMDYLEKRFDPEGE